ncbi:hypothetical protein IEQ34_005548 [Dendrobium chrysotoxum]|uniref:Uncharacterized protein n=1 Tax=Dendrobium chrysotoxum TaxID=161865 RepID=A0AAV7HBD5_DENCH|nr:hypothetical protein IEQ34_005548 [Dendrobium chrysotoxum]
MAMNRLVDASFLDGPIKSQSFCDALYSSSLDARFLDLKPISFRGFPSLWIFEEEILALAAPLHFALVGFFPSRRPSLDSIRRFFFNLKLISDCSVTLMDSSHILIKLVNDIDYSRVFLP